MSAVPVLETRGLGIRFGGLKAVDDVSLSVPEGLTLGVIGPNGAGKSTFINLVTCLLYTSDAADERSSVDLGGRRIIKKKKQQKQSESRDVKHKQKWTQRNTEK